MQVFPQATLVVVSREPLISLFFVSREPLISPAQVVVVSGGYRLSGTCSVRYIHMTVMHT